MPDFFPDHYSSPGTAKCPLCVCVTTISFERNDFWPRYFTRRFTFTVSRSSLKVKVIGQEFTVTSYMRKMFRFGCRCTLRIDIYILNRQRAAPNVRKRLMNRQNFQILRLTAVIIPQRLQMPITHSKMVPLLDV